MAALPKQAVAVPLGPAETRRPNLGVSTDSVGNFESFVPDHGTVPNVWDMLQAWSTGKPLDVQLADNVISRGVHLPITWMPWDGDQTQPVGPLRAAEVHPGVHHRRLAQRLHRPVRPIPVAQVPATG